jgi:hypothetical protein
MIGELVRSHADIAVGALSQTYARDQVVEYLPPYRVAPFGLLTLVRENSPPFWGFLSPFTASLWACLVALVAAIALATWISDRL